MATAPEASTNPAHRRDFTSQRQRKTKTGPSIHPLRSEILTPLLGAKHEIVVAATDAAKGKSEAERRELDTSLYEVRSEIPAGTRILLIDDTWTTGGHIQSVAMALKQAGEKVAALWVARYMDQTDPKTKRVLVQHFRDRPYDPDLCPWTGSACPPSVLSELAC